MGVRIPIPEIDNRFESKEDLLCQIIRFSNVIVEKAKIKYPIASVANINGYALEFCKKVLQQATTMVKIAREREDYNTVCSLVRILADNISIINLIYGTQRDDEKELRHLLYVLDGVTFRYDSLKNRKMEYDGKIPVSVYYALKSQVEGTIENSCKCIEYCTDSIKRSLIYKKYPNEVESLIGKKNWKYKSINKPNEVYSWYDLYGMLNITDGRELFSYMSQYIHGLSISNIDINDKDDFEAPLSFAYCLMGSLFDFIHKTYSPYIGEYTIEEIQKIVPEWFIKQYISKLDSNEPRQEL